MGNSLNEEPRSRRDGGPSWALAACNVFFEIAEDRLGTFRSERALE
jgi:hypothetical protein